MVQQNGAGQINRHSPSDFRIAIGTDDQQFSRRISGKRMLANICRMRDITQIDKEQLDQFLASVAQTGRYHLLPGLMLPGQSQPRFAYDLAIEKRKLTVMPAWQICDPPLCAALGGIEDPVVPAGMTDPPFNQWKHRIQQLPE
ncbi:MAG: hypothetical protein U0105_27485 [Candidatus Obscuribacterales bacterium]